MIYSVNQISQGLVPCEDGPREYAVVVPPVNNNVGCTVGKSEGALVDPNMLVGPESIISFNFQNNDPDAAAVIPFGNIGINDGLSLYNLKGFLSSGEKFGPDMPLLLCNGQESAIPLQAFNRSNQASKLLIAGFESISEDQNLFSQAPFLISTYKDGTYRRGVRRDMITNGIFTNGWAYRFPAILGDYKHHYGFIIPKKPADADGLKLTVNVVIVGTESYNFSEFRVL